MLFLSSSFTSAQKVFNYENNEAGEIFLTSEISIPKIHSGYTVWLPDTGKIIGLIIFTHSRRDTINSEFIIDYANQNQLAVLYATTENRLEFFFDNSKMLEIEKYIQEVLDNYKVPKQNLLFCGMSLEGTRALRLAIFSQSQSSKFNLKPKAIALCDSPLDMIRFHKEMIKAKKLNFTSVTANEGTWVSGYLESNLGGTPKEKLNDYINYSSYCYIADGGKYLGFFKDISIRAYTEPDVNWWIETRRKDYYSMNAVDLAAFVNELKILGNENAELIITQNKGYHLDGTRHPHSWSIVNEKELVDWFLDHISSKN
jgi:hypothetical protein